MFLQQLKYKYEFKQRNFIEFTCKHKINKHF